MPSRVALWETLPVFIVSLASAVNRPVFGSKTSATSSAFRGNSSPPVISTVPSGNGVA